MSRHAAESASTAELMARLADQSSRLVRDEVALAKAEISEKAKNAGIGAGAFGAAAVLAWFAFGVLLAAAVLGLAEVWPAWLSALVVGLAVLAVAGVAAMVGRAKVQKATPPAPTEAIENVKLDLAEVKEARHHDHD